MQRDSKGGVKECEILFASFMSDSHSFNRVSKTQTNN